MFPAKMDKHTAPQPFFFSYDFLIFHGTAKCAEMSQMELLGSTKVASLRIISHSCRDPIRNGVA
jgi:hypothetical protein